MSLDKLIQTAKETNAKTAAPFIPQGGTFPLDQIQMRVQDTRSLDEKHVADLIESIAVLGLIEPLALDAKGRLLAGGHRLAAIQRIAEDLPKVFSEKFPKGMIPSRVFEIDAEQESDLAFQIEVAENEKRRDYTRTEVKGIAERLKNAGFAELKGRPKKGQKALMPALSVVIGKSIRRVRQYLNEEEESPGLPEDKSRKLFRLLSNARNTLAEVELLAPQVRGKKTLGKKMPALLKELDAMIEKFQ